ncbi:MAG: ATP-binding protein [Pyrinomonadaceae bacterium]
MNLRTKLLLVVIAGSLVPVLLGVVFYRQSVKRIEEMVREDVESETVRIAQNVKDALRERELGLTHLAQSSALRDDVQSDVPPSAFATRNDASATGASAASSEGARAAIGDFISLNQERYSAITLVSAEPGRAPTRFEPPAAAGSNETPRVKTGDLLPGQPRPDERVWAAFEPKPWRSPVTRTSTGTACLVYTMPVFSSETERRPRAAIVAELKLDALLQEAGNRPNAGANSASAAGAHAGNAAQPAARLLIALDGAGQIIYHSNDALKYQPVNVAMPYFVGVAREMQAGRSGTIFYRAPADGMRWLASYQALDGLNLSVAVAGNFTRAVAGLRRTGLIVLGLSLSFALAATLLLFVIATRATRRIKRVTAAATAIATTGDLNQRLDLHAEDETRSLAEGFNRMSDRLRELIAHEAETRQFQSFVRLSAMLTHDLKNAIMGLSMLVTNMERQFHRAEFREDAISSLREATEKLGGLVARLSEPVKSLSGEYHRAPRPVDLIPVLKRVLATTAAPAASYYEIKTELPESLVAPVDVERIERVIENLLVNALEAMGAQGGLLTIAAGQESESLVFFSVADTGPGISEEFIRTRLFRAFATTKKRGIGLGLYTCREIVEAHGGRLDVESKLGSGTRFRVVLPSVPILAAHARSSDKAGPGVDDH